jgi:protein YibB
MGNITIVTAFFDIGRGDWTPEKGLPHYLHRSNETYLERFGHLATLNNEMVIFTSADLVDKITPYRVGKEDITKIITIDYKDMFKEERLNIATIQTDEEYRSKINPSQIKNPEYWSADYVLVNFLKSHFVNHAIESGSVTNDTAAWIDFGYCRDMSMLGGHTEWNYDFTKDKIHFFQHKEFDNTKTILDVIANNDVHILGAKIVASVEMWPTLEKIMDHSIREMMKHKLIDDDQTVMLISSLLKPELFEIHKIVPDHTWIEHNSIFKEYNV